MKEDMLEAVVEIIRNTYKRYDITIDSGTNLLDDLNLNSLEIAELMSAFEDEFDIEIPDRILMSLFTVKDIVEFIEKNR